MFFVFKLNTKYEIFDSICGYLNVLFHFFISVKDISLDAPIVGTCHPIPSHQIPLQLNQANLCACACAGASAFSRIFSSAARRFIDFQPSYYHHHPHHHHLDCQTSSSAFSNAINMGRQRHNNNNHQTAFACPAGGIVFLCFMLYVSL